MDESKARAEERIAELEALVASFATERASAAERIATLEKERDILKASHERLRLEFELLKHRLFVAKAERVDTKQLELEFKSKLRALEELAGTLEMGKDSASGGTNGKGKGKKPTGRRDLRTAPLEERRIELADPVFDRLVAEGKAERIGTEESCKLAWQRGGMRRLVIARVKYRTVGALGEAMIATTMMPRETFSRSLAAPSMLAHIVVEKSCDGLPLFRLEDRFARDGVPLDRGTMSRWLEDAGATVGATIVVAMRDEAMRTACCIATDATGVAIQPTPTGTNERQACRRGHYFVQIADKDAIFFEYTPRETSAVVGELFKGFTGYIQADAKSVYDALFDEPGVETDGGPQELGCMSHCRRKYWEATVAKSVVAREGLARLGRIFELDATWKSKPPEEIRRLRDAHLRPHLESFFAWATEEYAKVEHERGLLRDALGYTVRQKDPLTRFLDDGRLVMDNNRSERELRRIAVGRKAWLFSGSDDHAQSAGNLFTLIASARLHRLDPEQYMRDIFRVLAHWPMDRYLELSPKYWAATRARLVAVELDAELGPLTVPAAIDVAAQSIAAPQN